MKILFMTYPLAFQSPGGGEQIILESLSALRSIGVTVDLFNPGFHKIEDYDIVHFFSCISWWDWKTIKSYNRPLVVTPTSWPAKGQFHKSLDEVKEVLRSRFGTREAYSLRSYFSYPDLFFPTTQKEKNLLNSFYNIPLERMSVIGNGVTAPLKIEYPDNVFVKETGLHDFILFAGSLRPNKNIDTLIRACQNLGKNLVIMGESSFDTKEYESHCREIAGSETLFIGFKQKGSIEYDSVFNACSMVVIPSDFETFCLAAAEGASIGKPVIVPRMGGTVDVFGEGGLYIDNGKSVKELSELISAISNGATSERETQLMKVFNERFSWENIAQEMLAGYTILI